VPKAMQRLLLILICAVAGVSAATEVYVEFDPQYLKEATAAEFWKLCAPITRQQKAENWCRARESNPRPTVYKTAALPLS
jgi:hypothetical protein